MGGSSISTPLDPDEIPLVAADPATPAPDADDRFPAPPPEFDPDARAAFRDMARNCGSTIYRMPSSCEMYLRQYLSKYEPERLALVDGLRRDVPNRIQQYDGHPDGYEDYLFGLTDAFGNQAGISREVAWWVVTAWATATGRPLGAPAPLPIGVPVGVPGARPEADELTLKVAMCGIAGAGGFFGGLIGIAAPFLIIVIGNMIFGPSEEEPGQKTALALGAVLIVVLCTVAAMAGGIGAAFGWHMGRGTRYPWTGFGAAFMATASTGAIVGFCCGPLNPITWIIMVSTGFGAAYTASARGGWG